MDEIAKKVTEFFASRDPARMAQRWSLAAVAAWMLTPEGQAVLTAALAKYPWAIPLAILLAQVVSNGKGRKDAPA